MDPPLGRLERGGGPPSVSYDNMYIYIDCNISMQMDIERNI